MSGARGPLRFFLGAFGEPGHAFPMLALGARLAERGHEVTLETWSRWRPHVVQAGMRFLPAPEYPLFGGPSDGGFHMYEAVVFAAGQTRAAVADFRPDVVVHDILTLAPAMAGFFHSPNAVGVLRGFAIAIACYAAADIPLGLITRELDFRRRFVPDVTSALLGGGLSIALVLAVRVVVD